MKRFLSVLRDIVFVIFVIIICGMIFMMSSGKHLSIAGYQVLRVISSSMEPAIPENTCIIIKKCPVEDLKIGDIITFTSDDPLIRGYYNTHRIHEIVEDGGETLYVTKGDALSGIDSYPVHQDQVAGIFVKELPGGRMIGKFFVALSDNKIYFLVIILPLMMCLTSYFWQIMGMVKRYDDEDLARDEESEEAEESKEESPEIEVAEEVEEEWAGTQAAEEPEEELAGLIVAEEAEDEAEDKAPRMLDKVTAQLKEKAGKLKGIQWEQPRTCSRKEEILLEDLDKDDDYSLNKPDMKDDYKYTSEDFLDDDYKYSDEELGR